MHTNPVIVRLSYASVQAFVFLAHLHPIVDLLHFFLVGNAAQLSAASAVAAAAAVAISITAGGDCGTGIELVVLHFLFFHSQTWP